MEQFVLKDLAGQTAMVERPTSCWSDHGHYWLARRLAVFSLKFRATEGERRTRRGSRRRGRTLLRARGRGRSPALRSPKREAER